MVLTMTTQGPVPTPTGSPTGTWGFALVNPANPKSVYAISASPATAAGDWDFISSYTADLQGATTRFQNKPVTGSVQGNTVSVTVPVSDLRAVPSRPLWSASIVTGGGSFDCPSGAGTLKQSDLNLPPGVSG